MTELDIQLNSPDKVEKFVQITNSCEYNIDLVYGRYIIDGKSIVGIFTLNLMKPVHMVIHGEECEDVIERLKENNYLV